jgi:histone H4
MLAGPARGRLHRLAGIGLEALERSGAGAGLCPKLYSELLASRLGLVAAVRQDGPGYIYHRLRDGPAGCATVGEGATEATNPATDEPWTGEEVAAALGARGGADGGWLTWAQLYSHSWRPEAEDECEAAPKQLGGGGHFRHRRVLRDNIQGVTAPMLTALMRKAGLAAEDEGTQLCFEESRGILKAYLENVIRDAVTHTGHARQKIVSSQDMLKGLEGQGTVLYGFGRPGLPAGLWSQQVYKVLKQVRSLEPEPWLKQRLARTDAPILRGASRCTRTLGSAAAGSP